MTGTEFWCARDLQTLLGYSQWRSFSSGIDTAITACQNAGYEPQDHFAHIGKMVYLPPAEDVKKVERRLKSEQKKLPKQVEALDAHEEDAE